MAIKAQKGFFPRFTPWGFVGKLITKFLTTKPILDLKVLLERA